MPALPTSSLSPFQPLINPSPLSPSMTMMAVNISERLYRSTLDSGLDGETDEMGRHRDLFYRYILPNPSTTTNDHGQSQSSNYLDRYAVSSSPFVSDNNDQDDPFPLQDRQVNEDSNLNLDAHSSSSPSTPNPSPTSPHQVPSSLPTHTLSKKDVLVDTPGGSPSSCWSGNVCEPFYSWSQYPGHYASCIQLVDGDSGRVLDPCGQCICHDSNPTSNPNGCPQNCVNGCDNNGNCLPEPINGQTVTETTTVWGGNNNPPAQPGETVTVWTTVGDGNGGATPTYYTSFASAPEDQGPGVTVTVTVDQGSGSGGLSWRGKDDVFGKLGKWGVGVWVAGMMMLL